MESLSVCVNRRLEIFGYATIILTLVKNHANEEKTNGPGIDIFGYGAKVGGRVGSWFLILTEDPRVLIPLSKFVPTLTLFH
jgi:hypothetical protein